MERTVLSSPSLVEVPATLNASAMLAERVAANPQRIFAEVKDEHGAWHPITISDFYARVRAVAKGLVAQGVNPGDRVGLIGDTSYEWSVADFAIFAAGAVAVPIYPSSSQSQLEWIVSDAGIKVVFAEKQESRDDLAGLSKAPTAITLDAAGLDAVAAAGADVSDADLNARTADVVHADLATIIYTSGTTGRPKGAMLTHGNLVVHAKNVVADPDFGGFVEGHTRVLLFLPLAHVFARLVVLVAINADAVIGFAPSHKTLAADLKSFKPTWMPLVPRVLETIYNRADTSMHGIRKTLFRWSAKVAREASAQREVGEQSGGHKFRYRIADRLVLGKVRALLGGNLAYVLAGGARLTPEVGHFFRGLGVEVLQGYGLTETTAAHSGSPDRTGLMGTVGKPIAGGMLTLAEDGEILTKGLNTFAGYWNAPEATAAVMRDGWFATGDLGEIVDGALTVVGRKKEVLVLSSGKNVQPAVLEDAMRSHPAIQDTVVVGEGKHFVSALVALDEALLPAWLTAHKLPEMTLEEASVNERVRELVGRAIAAANAHVSRAEAIKEFRILPRGFSEAREEVTASLKIRRDVILKHFADVVDEIYSRARTTQEEKKA